MNQSGDIDLDTQPEQDVTPARMLAMSMGLLVGFALLIGALIGGFVGRFLVDGVLGLDPDSDIWIGAIGGAIILATVVAIVVNALTSRAATRMDRQSPDER